METTGDTIHLQSEEDRLSKPRKRILMVEDDADIRRLNTEDLRNVGYLVDGVKDGATAWDALQLNSYHLLITDQHWPKLSGSVSLPASAAINYNFCRTHQTLRATSAMEAGIADHVWSLEEIANLTN